MDGTISELRDSLEEYLHGLVICDYISRDEEDEVLNDFDSWAQTANIGDTYYYDDNSYTVSNFDEEDEE